MSSAYCFVIAGASSVAFLGLGGDGERGEVC